MVEVLEPAEYAGALLTVRLENGRTAHVVPLTFERARIVVDDPKCHDAIIDGW